MTSQHALWEEEATTFFEFHNSSTLNAHLDLKIVIQIFKIYSGYGWCVKDLTKPSKKFLYFVKPRSWIHSTAREGFIVKPYKSLPIVDRVVRILSYGMDLARNDAAW